MIIAGAESTASAIRSTLIHTMTTPRVYTKLKAEIKTALKDGSISNPIRVEEAQRLSYLQAVIYEGIRSK
jgi:cytochrome P450